MLTEETRRLNNAQERDAITALRRAERNLEERLARHVSALRADDRFHASEPLYQALYFVLERLCRRRKRMEEELAMREASRRADQSPALRDKVDKGVAKRAPAGNPVAALISAREEEPTGMRMPCRVSSRHNVEPNRRPAWNAGMAAA